MTAGQRWRREAPKVEGWYWWRQEPGMMAVPREVLWHPYFREWWAQGERIVEGDGEWQGPITPHDQEAG